MILFLIALLSTQSFADSSTLRIALVGDVIPGSNAEKFKYDPPSLKQIEQFQTITAGSDFVVGNLEGTLCDQGIPKKCAWQHPCYAFRLPEAEASLFKRLGFRMMSVANNHTLDFESVCRDRTISALQTQGIMTSGVTGQVARLTFKGVNVSLIAFHASAHFNSTLDLKRSARLIRKERKKSDLLMIYFHGGGEGVSAAKIPFAPELYLGENRGDVVAFSRSAVLAGADLVFGSGPHVIRGCEFYRGKLISYSLGDQIFAIDRDGESFEREGLVLQIEFKPKGHLISHQFRSTSLTNNGWPVLDSKNTALERLRTRSNEAFKTSDCADGK